MATYQDKEIAKWTVNDLIAYMSDEHARRFNCDYKPMGSWAAERGRIGRIFGTAKKPGTHDKETVKAFVDRCFVKYKPTAQYPGVNFGFMATYMSDELQILERQLNQAKSEGEAVDIQTEEKSDIENWFVS